MNNIPVYVLSNPKHHWLLPGFAYCFNTFWNGKKSVRQPVKVLSTGKRDKFIDQLPMNFKYKSIRDNAYHVNEWSDFVIQCMRTIKDEHFILMLEDYWLNAHVKLQIVYDLFEYITGLYEHEDLLRIDLTADRASKKRISDFEHFKGIDIISSSRNSKYQMSFQAAIWNRRNFQSTLVKGETPWEAEINGTKRLQNHPKLGHLLVLGTKNRPVPYYPVYRAHKRILNTKVIPKKHFDIMTKKGILTRKKGIGWV